MNSLTVTYGGTWKKNGVTYRFAYRKHKGKTYKRKQKKTKTGWVFVGLVLVLLAAAVWAPAGGFSWLFRHTMR